MLNITDIKSRRNDAAHRSAVTIGNFDGCHLGHRQLVEGVLALGRELKAKTVAMTFRPRPDVFFGGLAAAEPLLFTEEQKSRALQELGIEEQHAQPFDKEFASLSPEAFYQTVLRQQLGAAGLVVGYDFRFGCQRRGDAKLLQEWATRDQVHVVIGEAMTHDGLPISSTRIRALLQAEGAVEQASVMLGRPYMLEGVIRQGDQLGRQLGVPTVNLEGITQLVPRYGIYAGWVALARHDALNQRPPVMRVPDDAIPAVFSLGVRPTVAAAKPSLRVEAHLVQGTYGPNQHYGLRAGFYLAHRLRDEKRFSSLEELKHHMHQDISEARKLLSL